MMKTITALMVAFTLLVATGGVIFAQDYQKGLEAYDKGDYATVFCEFRASAQ